MRFLYLLALLPFAASAQSVNDYVRDIMIPVVCGPYDIMIEKTEEMGYGDVVAFTGISSVSTDVATQVLVNPENGYFTVLNWYASDNVVCVFSNGMDYLSAFPPLGLEN